MKNENMNLPEVPVSTVVELLTTLYTKALNGPGLKASSSAFLWGPPGVGKSEGVMLLARRLYESTGRRVILTDVRLYLYAPVDVRGVLVADENKEFTKWLRPKVFDLDPSEEVINILFLDELTAATQDVQKVAYQITLDRAVGEHALPDNCVIIGAGNRTTDHSVSYRMPKALCNRMKHFSVRADYDSWRFWAMENRVEPLIISFLAAFRDRLIAEPQVSEVAYPTPRSWKLLSNDLGLYCGDSEDICGMIEEGDPGLHTLISANVGVDTALSLEKWCAVYRSVPSVDAIFKGTCRTYPRAHEVLYALEASLSAAVRDRAETLTAEELENACAYVSRFPADFAASFFLDLRGVEILHRKLMGCPSMKAWILRKGCQL